MEKKSIDFIGSSQDKLLIKVGKYVISIFFLEENIIYLQEKRTHLLVDGSVTMETQIKK